MSTIDKIKTELSITIACGYITEKLGEIQNKTPFFVYVLRSEINKDLMYCGYTNNIKKRLRQHNGLIKGGGKYTSTNRPWNLACVIPANTKSEALKVEYWLKAKNYPCKSFLDNSTDNIMRSDIPCHNSVVKRVFLIRNSMLKHNLTNVLFLDDDMSDEYNKTNAM